MEIIERKEFYEFAFKFSPRMLQLVKLAPGRRWNPELKLWYVPKTSKDVAALLQFARMRNIPVQKENVEAPEPEHYSEIPELPELTEAIELKRELFPYQRKGVAQALNFKRCLIGDEPGLGKTGQAIAAIAHAKAFPCLVVCPSSLKENWRREWELWTNYKAIILNDSVKENWFRYYEAGMAQVFIVNYESLKKYFVEKIDTPKGKKMRLDHIHFKSSSTLLRSIIADESHRVKSAATQQTKFTKGIAVGKEYILLLSGTPVVNKPKDLITQLFILDQLKNFGGYNGFVNRYCSGPNEASNLRELNYKLNSSCFFRRAKTEVLKDLPPKMRQVVYCDITTRKEYNEALKDLVQYMREYKNASDQQIQKSMKGEIMVRIGILKNISARGKMPDVFEFISDTLESGEKLVVFAHLKEVISKIREHFPDSVSVTGDDDMQARQAAVDSFQNNPACKLILCSIQAAGVGLTLTASSRVAFVEQGWHPAIMEQCEDRCHRIGQQDSVSCYYFLGKETIDIDIYKIINSKREMVNTITGATDDVEVSVIDNVINLFSEPKTATA